VLTILSKDSSSVSFLKSLYCSYQDNLFVAS
jgi:hypothetical protein